MSTGRTAMTAGEDESLLDLVQRTTFRCFWDLAHPVSGLARDRSDVHPLYGPEAVTTGGSGFGVMAIIVACSRGWICRPDACWSSAAISIFRNSRRARPWCGWGCLNTRPERKSQ